MVKTVNEVRREHNLPPLPGPPGEAFLPTSAYLDRFILKRRVPHVLDYAENKTGAVRLFDIAPIGLPFGVGLEPDRFACRFAYEETV